MENMIYKKIELENHQTLVISDISRKISADAYVVIMKANIEIKIEKQLFLNDAIADFKFEDILATLGDTVIYEYRIERNFIMAKEKDEVFEALVKTFLDNLGQYMANPKFPGKLVLKEYKDRIK
ncbi:hypothetical protein [Desulfobacula sp.]|uniref:hypothetical protein n=1 Tax=Desulfobacula sp. TaxID=2593537 RepID=UPI002636A8B0|nr:hypothetical protein [Desulfobacula sp.]